MALWVLRCFFIVVSAGVAITLIFNPEVNKIGIHSFALFAAIMGACFTVITVDALIPRKPTNMISSVYFGTIVGLLLAWILTIALEPLFTLDSNGLRLKGIVALVLGVLMVYICISLLMQTRDDLRFIIPYIEFAREVKGHKPYILDTSAIIDGRIAQVIETGVFENRLVMPRFVLSELQNIADSNDRLRRQRGRRGLDILNELRGNAQVDFVVHDHETPEMKGEPVDMKLVLLAKHLEGKIITGDYNLNKVATVHNVSVINMNEIANALKPALLPGETVEVQVVKAGEEPGQGVGYLEDGTMIVIDGGHPYVGRQVVISITSFLQTSAGRMIFGKFESIAGEVEDA